MQRPSWRAPSGSGTTGEGLAERPSCDDADVSGAANLMIRWGLAVDGPSRRGWMSTVWPVRTRDGRRLVLKLLDAHHPATGEDLALRAWAADETTAGRVVRLETGEGHTLLLERLDADRPLEDHPDAAAADETIGDLIATLTAVVAPPKIPRARAEADRIATSIRDRATSGIVPDDRVDRALRTLAEAPDGDRLLHWDLHYLNVLRDLDDRRWVAIDPLPKAGVPEWEVVAALRNRWPDVAADPDRLLRERLHRLCAPGGLDEDLAAALAQAVAVDNVLHLVPAQPDHLLLPPYLVLAGW